MKAPEKIYLYPYSTDGIYEVETKPLEGTVEYTRTDVFIKKALAYLHDKFYFNNEFYGVVSTDFNAMEEMYEDFEKYMKGGE